MPVLAKGSKKGKGGKGGSKKGAVKIIPDPDAAYKQQLDEAFYIPKPSRLKINKQYTAVIDAAIRANTLSVTAPSPGESAIPDRVLLSKIPEIVRSLGLCATDDQMDQICCMVTQAPPAASKKEAVSFEGVSYKAAGSFADTEKVRQVLSEMLHTHILAYDPQVLSSPDPRFPTRVSSVIYKVSEQDLASCFEAIWEATGKKSTTRKDGTEVRCFTADELEAVMAEAQKEVSSILPLTKNELDDLYFFVNEEGSEIIGEDAFLRCLTDVK